MRRIADGLYSLEAGGDVNSYLIEDVSGLVLVDAGRVENIEELVQEIKDGGFLIEQLRQLILTHAHADHIGGAAVLLRRHRVKVLAHPEDIPAIRGQAPLPPLPGRWQRWAHLIRPRPEPVEIIVPVVPGRSVKSLARWQVLHTPGHTPGSLSLYDPVRGILLCGDALGSRAGKVRMDVAAEGRAAAAKTLGQLALLTCEMLGPGHGGVIRSGAARQIQALNSHL